MDIYHKNMDYKLLLLSAFMLMLHVCTCTKDTTISSCYNGTCLSYVNTTLSFDDATSLCKSRRQELLFIDDDVAQNNSIHLLGRLNRDVPVWLNMKHVDYAKWKYIHTEEEYQDRVEEGAGDCVYLEIAEEGMATKPFSASCQMKKHFICRNNSVRGDCKDCFVYNTSLEVTWFTARQLCQDGDHDLDLAYWSKMDFSKSPGLSKLNFGGHFWIGLRRSDWLWLDDEPVKYNNFSGRYPIPGTDCGLLLSTGAWATSHCGDRFGVVCRTPKRNRRISVIPTSQTTLLPSSSDSTVTSPSTVTSQRTPQFHKKRNTTATLVLAGTLVACFLVIFIFTFISFWCLKNRSTKFGNAGKASIEQPQPEVPLEFSNPSFRENSRRNSNSQIPENNYIYYGGPSCQYDVIYTDVARYDVTNKPSSSIEE